MYLHWMLQSHDLKVDHFKSNRLVIGKFEKHAKV